MARRRLHDPNYVRSVLVVDAERDSLSQAVMDLVGLSDERVVLTILSMVLRRARKVNALDPARGVADSLSRLR